MLTEEKLIEREEISIEEIKELMDHFDTTEMDLADECGLTHSTFSIYFGNNETGMPQKHQETIIHYFLKQFAGGEEGPKYEVVSDDTSKEPQEENAKDGLQHLIPDVIIYKPKKKVSNALEEAAMVAKDKDTEVIVQVGNRKIFLRVEEGKALT